MVCQQIKQDGIAGHQTNRKMQKQLHAYCQLGEGLIKLLICMTSAKKKQRQGVQEFNDLLFCCDME